MKTYHCKIKEKYQSLGTTALLVFLFFIIYHDKSGKTLTRRILKMQNSNIEFIRKTKVEFSRAQHSRPRILVSFLTTFALFDLTKDFVIECAFLVFTFYLSNDVDLKYFFGQTNTLFFFHVTYLSTTVQYIVLYCIHFIFKKFW